MLGLYLLARFFAWFLGVALLVFVIFVYFAVLLVAAILALLLDPNMWRSRRRQGPMLRPSPQPDEPQNERLFYSDRR